MKTWTPHSLTVAFLCAMGWLIVPATSDAQWEQARSPSSGWITDMVVLGENLFVCTREGGVFRTGDEGQSWEKITKGLPRKADFQSLAVSGEVLFAGTVAQGAFCLAPNEEKWKAVSSGLPRGSSVWRMVASDSGLIAVAGGNRSRVYSYSANGERWMEVSSGLPDAEVVSLAVSGSDLFAGTYGRGVFRSTDGGASWTSVNNQKIPPNAQVFRLAALGKNVFAGTYAGGWVFKTRDRGESWKPVNDGLPAHAFFSLSDLEVSERDLFLGSFRGVFVFSENPDRWTKAGSGMPDGCAVYALAASDTHLFAGTENGEVWRLSLSPVSTDNEEAAEFRQNLQSAEQGDAIAQFKVGYAYHFGLGVTPDAEASFRWMKLAADQGVAEAQLNVGQYYQHGVGVDQDYEAARQWYLKAAEQKIPEAAFFLFEVYGGGPDVTFDGENAIRWLKEAAEMGLPIAQYVLAMGYFEGFVFPAEPSEALIWLERSANQNHANAQFTLGTWYEEGGRGVEEDAVTACMWFLLAAANGHEQAPGRLLTLAQSLNKKEQKRAERMANKWVEEHQ